MTPNPKHQRGAAPAFAVTAAFTLVELLVVMAVIAILGAMLLPALGHGKTAAWRADCLGNVRQLALATQMYWDDHGGGCFKWAYGSTNGGATYWFGWIEGANAEGRRRLDLSLGVLYPYIKESNIRLCPSLNYALAQFKLKANRPVYGYGYNLYFSETGVNAARLARPSSTTLFADAAQVNDFQAPASDTNPMLEEWYYVSYATNFASSTYYPNGHFRHARRANVVFCDGHVDKESMVPGSLDRRLPAHQVGCLPQQILTLR